MENIKRSLKSKVIILLWSIIFCPLWGQNNFFENLTEYFSLDSTDLKTPEINSGVKLLFPLAETRFAQKNTDYNFGISWFSYNITNLLPITFKTGNLSIGGAFSDLKTPTLDSSSSGFSNTYSQPSCITSSLPSYTSFSNPLSTFFEIEYKNQNKIYSNSFLNFFVTPEERKYGFSTKVVLNFKDIFSMVFSKSFIFFELEENTQSSWYLENQYYKKDKTFCISSQIASQIETKLFNCNNSFSIFTYKTPFGKFENIYKTENKIQYKYFTLGFDGYFNTTTSVISPSNTAIPPSIELKGNVQFKIPWLTHWENEAYLKTGFTTFYNYDKKDGQQNLKLCTSSLLKFKITELLIEGNCSLNYNKENESYIIDYFTSKIKNHWQFNFCSPSVELTSKYNIDQENNQNVKNYKIALDWDFNKLSSCINTYYSFSVKNNIFYNKKLKIAITINRKFKKLLLIMKFNGDFCI